ncbi:ImmA/IrrE family metallo-endopeptidase [Enterococcus mundtii]|uniref:ImmA/IrrE family metallo-endopeptidase n=1 Tax=Enterococcus mundtii TaxID=53346 RepID=UPI001FB9B02A|nr:ImmA/IrrE family metallo-endopeptidase [Enterococcus mundtii]GKS55034.1 hypothetical protein EMLAB_16490 [Enterococcus mundtii]
MDVEVSERIESNNLLINRFLLENDINPIEYNWEIYFEKFITDRKIEFINNPPKLSLDFYSGFTVKSNYTTAIFINPSMVKSRQRFSAAHESDHIIYDFDDNQATQKFFNVEENTTFYTEEELKIEALANAGAGVKMLPDITIVKFMETDISFYKMADVLGLSYPALYTRLVQFCQTTLNINGSSASSLVQRFQNNKNDKYFINQRLSGWGSTKKKEIVYAFQNSI